MTVDEGVQHVTDAKKECDLKERIMMPNVCLTVPGRIRYPSV